MPQNRLKLFPTAVLRRGMAHFHPALPMPGYLPCSDRREVSEIEAGGPRPTGPLGAEPVATSPATAPAAALDAARGAPPAR